MTNSIHERSKTKELPGELLRVKNIYQCARCGGTHEHVTFQKFTSPIECDGQEYNYWTLCPTNGEPIIMAREVEQEKVVKDG